MSLAAANLLIGPVTISIDGTDMGFTTEDGVTLSPGFETQFFRGAQSPVIAAGHRSGVDMSIKATFAELSLANLRVLLDTDTAVSSLSLTPAFQETLNQRTIVITGAGPTGGTRVLTCTAVIESVGEYKMANNEYGSIEATFRLLGSPSANTYFVIQDAASASTVPAVATFQKVVSGTETTIADGATGVAVAAKIQITFNVAIRADQLTAGKFLLKTVAGNVDLAAAITFGTTASATDFTKVVINPTASMAGTTEHEIIVPAGLLSVDGIPSAAAYALQFTTT